MIIKNQESLYSPNASADTQEFDMAISYTQTQTQTCLKQSHTHAQKKK